MVNTKIDNRLLVAFAIFAALALAGYLSSRTVEAAQCVSQPTASELSVQSASV